MKNNSNMFIAVGAIIAFIFIWDHFVVSRYGPARNLMPRINNESTLNSSSANQSNQPQTQSAAIPVPSSNGKSSVTSPTSTTLEVDNATIQVESWGARISSWKVKEKESWIELVYRSKDSKQLPLETFPNLDFIRASKTPNQVIYTAVHPDGFRIQKTITLNEESKLSQVVLEFFNPTQSAIKINSGFGWGEGLAKHSTSNEVKSPQAEAMLPEMRAIGLADQLRKWKAGVIFGRTVDQISHGPFKWVGVANNHFLAVLLPVSGEIQDVQVYADRKIPPMVSIPLEFQLAPGESKKIAYNLYVGPKKIDNLKALGFKLDEAVDFGAFGVISKGLLSALEFFHRLTGNYGWAIVLLTLCIQVAVFPLTKRSLEHSVKMKVLQPQLKKLQEQFKSDPKRMQIETLNLYKKHGMHFMGLEGCLPILLQIPVFFAFYAALNGAYELRGAPWIFWIHNLAAPDPYYVLPILMGAGMFLQQKLTTVPTDPSQAKMMMMMPIFFVFMFFRMPSGLVLYWSINSVCTILSQRILALQKPSSTEITT